MKRLMDYDPATRIQTWYHKDAIDGTFVPVPADEVIVEHDGLKAAKSLKELAEIFNALPQEEKAKFKPYYSIRHDEFVEAS